MKNIFLAILLASSFVLSAQVEVTNTYLGMLNGASYSLDSQSVTSFSNVRVGGEAQWGKDKIFLKTFGVFQTPDVTINGFYLEYKSDSSLVVDIGKMPVLSAYQRPKPVSSGGQFEPWSLRQIPGGGIGGAVRYFPNENIEFSVGGYLVDTALEIDGRVKLSNFVVSGYFQPETNIKGGAVTLSFGRISTTAIYKNDEIISDLLLVTFGKDKDIIFYSDTGFGIDGEVKDMVRGEWGPLKAFDEKDFAGLFGFGYAFETNSIQGYLQIYFH